MPQTVQALVVFALFIVPGFLLRAGYLRTRIHGLPETDIYALAQGIVGSLGLLAIVWWLGGQRVFNWQQAGVLEQHQKFTYFVLLSLLVVPYPLGILLGWLVDSLLWAIGTLRSAPENSRRQQTFRLLELSGLLDLPTVWDHVWSRLPGGGAIYVRIRTRSGGEIVGAFDERSLVALTPDPPQVFLSRVYREVEDGRWEDVPNTEGALIDAKDIESIEFVREGPPEGKDQRQWSSIEHAESSVEEQVAELRRRLEDIEQSAE